MVVVLDQAAKAWLKAALSPGLVLKVTSFFNLVHVQNQGVAFGLWSSGKGGWLLVGLTAAALAALLGWVFKIAPQTRAGRWGLGLALGGAAGNLIDRLRFQAVTDFLDFHLGALHWPAFNVADASLSVGFGLLILVWLKGR